MTKRPHEAADKNKIVELRRKGMSYIDIAQRMRCSPDYVSAICRKNLSADERKEILKKFGRDR